MTQYRISGLGCGASCLKLVLAILNIAFFIAGLAVAILSGIAAFNPNSKIHQMLASYNFPQLNYGLYTLFAVSVVLTVIAFIGMWGTIAENNCLLSIYFIVVFVVLVAELAGVIICCVEGKKLEAKLIEELSKRPPPSNETGAVVFSFVLNAALNLVESEHHCCGVTGPTNYGVNSIPTSCYAPAPAHPLQKRFAFPNQVEPIPLVRKTNSKTTSEPTTHVKTKPTTTKPTTTGATTTTTTTTTEAPVTTPPHGPLYTTGCIEVVKPYLLAVVGIAIAVMVLEILVLVFICCLMSAINDQYTPV